MTRRILLSLLATGILVAAPGIAYETLEKAAERIGPGSPLLAKSLRAEIDTPWRPATGVFVVDRALHEMEETRHFWRLVNHEERGENSAAPVATVVTGG